MYIKKSATSSPTRVYDTVSISRDFDPEILENSRKNGLHTCMAFCFKYGLPDIFMHAIKDGILIE